MAHDDVEGRVTAETEGELHKVALEVLAAEGLAIEWTRHLLNPKSFTAAVRLIAAQTGAVITTGIGKSALVAQRIAATLRVSAVPSWFLHPVEAQHGDIGGVNPDKDLLLVCSRSGESEELAGILHYAGNEGMPVVAITAGKDSTLATAADVVLLHSAAEACKHGLTPTASVTSAGALGDALAVALQAFLGFDPKTFAALHPDGTLGRRLTTRVREVMLPVGDVGYVQPTCGMLDVLVALANCRGTIAVVPSPLSDRTLLGVVTAGDVSRYIPSHRSDRPLDGTAKNIMASHPFTCTPEGLVVDALHLMQEVGVMALPVVNPEYQVVGMIHLHDALKARVQ